MKSLSALKFSPDCSLTLIEHNLTISEQQSHGNNSPDIKLMKRENDFSSPSICSSSSSSNSPSPHPLLPPLLPLAALSDPPPQIMPLFSSFVPGRFGQPMEGGASFLTFPQPNNGNSFVPFNHPASVFLRHQQAALAYSYALLHHRQHQHMLQQKQFNKNRSTLFFRPHELTDRHHYHQPQQIINSSSELPYYLQKIVPFDCNDGRLNKRKTYRPNTSVVLNDQSPIDLRKSSTDDDASHYNNQQFLHAPSKKNPTSGKKLIGIRFLFPPFADHVTLHERAKIWVARHEYKYFVDWSPDDLLTVDLELRPIQPITRQQYKIHMNRSEFCRNVKLKFCLQTDSPWAKDFCEKLQKSPAEGGFTGLCQAKIAAADLWRTYSENYRSHQARQPNGTSLKSLGNSKTTPAKKRSLVTDENITKKSKMDILGKSTQIDEQDSEFITNQQRLSNNDYYYYYYRPCNNDQNFQISRDYIDDRKLTSHEMGPKISSPGRCQVQQYDQSNRSKIYDKEINEDKGIAVTTKLSLRTEPESQKPTIWKPFLKNKNNDDDDGDQLPMVGNVCCDKYIFDGEEGNNINNVGDSVKEKWGVVKNILRGSDKKMTGSNNSVDQIINRSLAPSDLHQQPHNSTHPNKTFSSRILEDFENRFFDLRSEDIQKSMNRYNFDNTKRNFTLEFKQLINKYGDSSDGVQCSTQSDETRSIIKNNQSKDHRDKFIQSDKYATSSPLSNVPESTVPEDEDGISKDIHNVNFNSFLLDKSRSVQPKEIINSLGINSDQSKTDKIINMKPNQSLNDRLNHHSRQNKSSNHRVFSSKIIDQSDDESDNEVDVVDVDDTRELWGRQSNY